MCFANERRPDPRKHQHHQACPSPPTGPLLEIRLVRRCELKPIEHDRSPAFLPMPAATPRRWERQRWGAVAPPSAHGAGTPLEDLIRTTPTRAATPARPPSALFGSSPGSEAHRAVTGAMSPGSRCDRYSLRRSVFCKGGGGGGGCIEQKRARLPSPRTTARVVAGGKGPSERRLHI